MGVDQHKHRNTKVFMIRNTRTTSKPLLTLLLMACKKAALPTFCSCFDICASILRFSFSMWRRFSSSFSLTALSFVSSTSGWLMSPKSNYVSNGFRWILKSYSRISFNWFVLRLCCCQVVVDGVSEANEAIFRFSSCWTPLLLLDDVLLFWRFNWGFSVSLSSFSTSES